MNSKPANGEQVNKRGCTIREGKHTVLLSFNSDLSQLFISPNRRAFLQTQRKYQSERKEGRALSTGTM